MPKTEYIVKMKNPLPFRAPDTNAWSVKILSKDQNTIDKAAQTLFTSLSRTILNEHSVKDIRFQIALCKNDIEKKTFTYSASIKQPKVKLGGGNTSSDKEKKVIVSIKQIKCGSSSKDELHITNQSKPKIGGTIALTANSSIALSPYYSFYPMLYDIYAFGDQDYINYWTYYINTPFWWLPNANTYNYWNYLNTPVISSNIQTIESGM